MSYTYSTENVLFLNSASASYKDLATGKASFSFANPLRFSDKKYRVAVHNFSFTNFFVNVTTGVNDLFYYTDDLLNLTKYSVTIQQGSYNVAELSDAINVGVINNGHTDGLISLIPDFSSNKVVVSISAAGWLVNWGPQTSYLLNGFALNDTVPASGLLTTGNYQEYAPNIATYNSITELYVKTSLTYNSVFSGKQSNVLFTCTPTASIGSTQNTEYNNLIFINSPEISNQTLSTINIDIVDQNDTPVYMYEDFSITLLFESYN